MAFSTSATPVSSSGSTGATCQKTGPYKSSTSVIVFFKRGDRFPADPTTGRSTTWRMSS